MSLQYKASALWAERNNKAGKARQHHKGDRLQAGDVRGWAAETRAGQGVVDGRGDARDQDGWPAFVHQPTIR